MGVLNDFFNFQPHGGLTSFLYEFHSLVDDEKEFSTDLLDSFLKEFGSFIYDIESSDGNQQDEVKGDGNVGKKSVMERRIEINVNMTKFYGYAGHQLQKMLLKCSWRRKPCSAANFTATFTDAGRWGNTK